MKQIFVALFFVFAQSAFAQTAKLTIVIDNLEAAKGQLEIGIYNQPEGFPHEGSQYKKFRHDVHALNETFSVELPVGEYAVAVYHDVNMNNKCDRNLIRIPTEGYGFSKNFKPRFSAPDFEDTKFRLDRDTTITIHLIQ